MTLSALLYTITALLLAGVAISEVVV